MIAILPTVLGQKIERNPELRRVYSAIVHTYLLTRDAVVLYRNAARLFVDIVRTDPRWYHACAQVAGGAPALASVVVHIDHLMLDLLDAAEATPEEDPPFVSSRDEPLVLEAVRAAALDGWWPAAVALTLGDLDEFCLDHPYTRVGWPVAWSVPC